MRGKYDFPELKQRLIRLNGKWRGKGLRAMYIEDKASGQSLLQELKRESGMSLIPYKVVHDKVARVNAILPLIEGGRVFIPEQSQWLDDFIDEAVSFPSGRHDDQVDAMTIAIDVLSRTSISPESWMLHTDTSQSLNNIETKTFGKSLKKPSTSQHPSGAAGACERRPLNLTKVSFYYECNWPKLSHRPIRSISQRRCGRRPLRVRGASRKPTKTSRTSSTRSRNAASSTTSSRWSTCPITKSVAATITGKRLTALTMSTSQQAPQTSARRLSSPIPAQSQTQS